MKFKQAPRREIDGEVSIRRNDKGELTVWVVHGGLHQHIVMSEHNASRVFGMLALMLEIPLPKQVGKAIKL